MTHQPSHCRTLRIALVGCGQIADAHLQEIGRIPGAQVVAVCDRYLDLARQAAVRFNVPALYDDLSAMLAGARPDVVHVTTPAQTHFEVARACLDAGCHVYVEKPFTQTAEEARRLIQLAEQCGRRLCVGHDQLFDPAWMELRRRVAEDEIGAVRHVESILGYPIAGPFGSQVAADPNHWVRRLSGGLFQNTISHPLYRITEFLLDSDPQLQAGWHAAGGFDFPTELWVQLRGRSVTGTLTFRSTIAAQRITRVYGGAGGLEVDLDGQVVRRIGPSTAPGPFAKLATPWKQWREAGRNVRHNLKRFLRSEIHYFAGLRTLCERFYDAVRGDGEPPISANEIVRTTQLMDRIFAEAGSGNVPLSGLSETPGGHALACLVGGPAEWLMEATP